MNRMENLSMVIQKQKRKEDINRLNFVTRFKIEFLLMFTVIYVYIYIYVI